MLIRCPMCNKHFEYNTNIKKFEGAENEFLQKECLKIIKKIDKLQNKHDYEDLPNWKLNEVNMQLSALSRIRDILEDYI